VGSKMVARVSTATFPVRLQMQGRCCTGFYLDVALIIPTKDRAKAVKSEMLPELDHQLHPRDF